jgi:hypothetical protein
MLLRGIILAVSTWLRLPLVSAVVCFAASGCALGPIASFDGADYSEIRSRNCAGLALERQQRLERIASLEAAMKSELTVPPTTLAQAVQRMGSAPEVGTNAYGELNSERLRLEGNAAEQQRIPCPVEIAKRS